MNSLNAVFAKLANETPSLYAQRFVPLSKSVFKVASLYAPLARPLTDEELVTMHATALGDQFTLMPETVEFVDKHNNRNLIVAFVRANLISKPYKPEEVKASMRCLSKNVFVDNEDTIWKIAGQGDDARLVQSKQEDFAAILKERINSQQNMVMASCTTDQINVHGTRNGDFVLFYSKVSDDLDHGYAFTTGDNYTILSFERKEYEVVPSEAIVCAVSIEPTVKFSPFNVNDRRGKAFAEDLAMTNNELTKPLQNKYREYMKFLYNGTDYFAKLSELINLRNANGNGLPVSTIR